MGRLKAIIYQLKDCYQKIEIKKETLQSDDFYYSCRGMVLMDIIKINTLTGSKNKIEYVKNKSEYNVVWSKTKFRITTIEIADILNYYFINIDIWLPLGAGMTKPTPGGLGEYISKKNKALTPRHASAIAPIMVNEGFIEYKKEGNAILLRKLANEFET